jgi:uncharacterized membrane protein
MVFFKMQYLAQSLINDEKYSVAIKRVKEKLWFRPLVFCILSIIGALIAQVADSTILHELVQIKQNLDELLNNISASMLVISIFCCWINDFSIFQRATLQRRAHFNLQLLMMCQNALSVFIGSFIYSIVALVALKNGYYGRAGHFVLLYLLYFCISNNYFFLMGRSYFETRPHGSYN